MTDLSLISFVSTLLLIVMARIMDVGMGTMRVVFISRGRKFLAAACGFIEVLIWIIAISKVLGGIQHWLAYVAYAGGYALGTLVGMWVEERLALGWVVLRLITNRPVDALVAQMSASGFGVTVADAQGAKGPVRIVYTMARRNRLDCLRSLLQQFDPKAFFTIEDAREVSQSWPAYATARTGAGKARRP